MLFQWIPPATPDKQREADEQISIDLGDEYEAALTDASQEEIIDLAGKSHHRSSLRTLNYRKGSAHIPPSAPNTRDTIYAPWQSLFYLYVFVLCICENEMPI